MASDHGSLLASLVGDNPYFTAGFGLMGIGVGFQALRKGTILATTALQRRLLVSLEMNNRDMAYHWFLAYMGRAQAQSRTGQSLDSWMRSHQLSVQTFFKKGNNGMASDAAQFKLFAGQGNHYFKYKGAWMKVVRERETRSVEHQTGLPWETVTLTTLSRDRHLFEQLLSEARDIALQEQEGKLVIRTASNFSPEWQAFGQPRNRRPVESVVLAPGVAERIQTDIKSFLNRRKWYADRGIPYRRGYLLHGPPGSGKTSFIQALAGSLSYDICVFNLSQRGMMDDKMAALMAQAPERSFILFEDVDAAFNKRVQTSADGYQSGITFSGFLNALDGVASGEERIVFMTTNHVEQLDPALIRPGRVDLTELIDDAVPEQARTLFSHFYAENEQVEESELEILAEQLQQVVQEAMSNGRRISMAALQGIFILHSPRTAIDACRDALVAS